jgi:hypothetical protein
VRISVALLRQALFIFLPVAGAATVLILLVYAAGQQSLRKNANDPQVQIAEDAATRLDGGTQANAVLPAQSVDLGRSLAPFVIVFGRDGTQLASSARLDGVSPQPPSGVLSAAKRSEITWAPRPDVREAAVIVPYRDGHVLSGRSLRLVEQREDALGQLTILFFTAMILVSGFGSLAAAWLRTYSP